MSAEQFVAASYRGLEVGDRLKLFDVGPTTAHLEFHEPLPTGTTLELKTDDGLTIPVTVVRVHEQVGGSDAVPGMRVRAELSGEANDWWGKLVSVDDPVIPEPAVTVGGGDKADDSEAVPDPIESQVTNPVEARNSTKKTQIMDVSEIQAAVDADGAEGEGDAGSSKGNGASTQQMSAEEIQKALEREDSEPSADDDDDSNGKKKKKKRRRKKKK